MGCDEPADQSARDADQHCHDDAADVSSGREPFNYDTGDAPDNDPAYGADHANPQEFRNAANVRNSPVEQ